MHTHIHIQSYVPDIHVVVIHIHSYIYIYIYSYSVRVIDFMYQTNTHQTKDT